MLRADELRKACEATIRDFEGHPDVLSIGIGEVFSGGQPARLHGLIFVVEEKDQAMGPILPRSYTFNGVEIPVDVQCVPKKEFQLKNNFIDGSDLLVSGQVGRQGTLGLVVREAGGQGRTFGITNAHVVTRPSENHMGDPIDAVIGGATRRIGRVAYHSDYQTGRRNRVDLALVALNASGVAQARLHRIQTINGSVKGSGRLSFSRFGGALRTHTYSGSAGLARHVVNCGMLSEHPAVVLEDDGVPMEFGRTFIFSRLSGAVRDGHSGSVLVRQGHGGLILDGLLAGGGNRGAFVFSFSDVLADLAAAGIELA
ncbi:MAG: hypothetical protein AB8B60_09520 [Sulfitobacter sp.]